MGINNDFFIMKYHIKCNSCIQFTENKKAEAALTNFSIQVSSIIQKKSETMKPFI